jgi:Mn-dependent DtxR family transcriptional regulator
VLKKQNLHVHLARLLVEARRKKGYASIKKIYQIYKPDVDYQTWGHAEAGRRIPHPNSLKEMAKILDIDRDDLIIAYCKDKFEDEESQQIIDTFPSSKFADVDVLLEAIDHNNCDDYVLTSKQVDAIRHDLRLRLFLIYTYDANLKTSFSRLAQFFKIDKSEVKKVIENLVSLGLVENIDEEVKRIHKHTTMPKTADVFDLRRQLLLKTLDLNLKPGSHVSNLHVSVSEDAYKKIMELLYFTEANLIKFDKEEKTGLKKTRFQIAIITNRIIGDGNDDNY